MTLEEFERIKKDDWCLVNIYGEGLCLVQYDSPVDDKENRSLHNIWRQNGSYIMNELHFGEHFGSFPELNFETASVKFAEYLI